VKIQNLDLIESIHLTCLQEAVSEVAGDAPRSPKKHPSRKE
jgi:hypothetical protein